MMAYEREWEIIALRFYLELFIFRSQSPVPRLALFTSARSHLIPYLTKKANVSGFDPNAARYGIRLNKHD